MFGTERLAGPPKADCSRCPPARLPAHCLAGLASLPAADTQGDISQARGQLGQLLFEFSQIELNRDLLEAIKRTESKTGVLCELPG